MVKSHNFLHFQRNRSDRSEDLLFGLVTSILLHIILFLGSNYWLRAFAPKQKQDLSQSIPIEYVEVPPNQTKTPPPETSRRAANDSVAGGFVKLKRPVSATKPAPVVRKVSASDAAKAFAPQLTQPTAVSPQKPQPKPQKIAVAPATIRPAPKPPKTAVTHATIPLALKPQQRTVTPATIPLALKPQQRTVTSTTIPLALKPPKIVVTPDTTPLAPKLLQRAVAPTTIPPETKPPKTAVTPATTPLAPKPPKIAVAPTTTSLAPKPPKIAVAPTTTSLAPKPPKTAVTPATTPLAPKPPKIAAIPVATPLAPKPPKIAAIPVATPPVPLTHQENKNRLAAKSTNQQLETKATPRTPSQVQPSRKSGASGRLGGPMSVSSGNFSGNYLAALPNSNRLNRAEEGVDAHRDDMAAYWEQLKQRVRRQWIPELTQSSRQTVIHFTVNRSGQVSNLGIEQPSGFRVTDEAALNAIKRAGPFAPLPTTYAANYIDIQFTFVINVYGELDLGGG